MDADLNIKVCPLCAEPIRAAAKVCPYCRHPQTRLAQWLPFLGLGVSTSLLLVGVGVVGLWLFPGAFRPEGRSFDRDRARLEVVRTSLERHPKKPEFWVNGFITNSGNYPWRIRTLEVRFIQGKDKLMDVRHENVSEDFVVQPNQEQAFRVGLGRLVFTNSDVMTRVRVQTAIDGNIPSKTE